MIATAEASRAAQVVDVLARALEGRDLPADRALASGSEPSPQEGLALMASFLAIRDASLRQALLDAAAMLGARVH